MSSPPPSDPNPTIHYYDEHANSLFVSTVNIDLTSLYLPFLELLPPGAYILDAGCGSGRDALYFLQHGYRVDAFDPSSELAALASALTGLPILPLTFQTLDVDEQYDGIWACASLLHVPRNEIHSVFDRLTRALKPSGLLYASFKWGDREEIRNGRLFSDYTTASFTSLLSHHLNLGLIRAWMTSDLRLDRSSETWLNTLVRKLPSLDSRPSSDPSRLTF